LSWPSNDSAADLVPWAGSEVFVLVKNTSNKTNYVALFGAMAQILASTVAIIGVVTQ